MINERNQAQKTTQSNSVYMKCPENAFLQREMQIRGWLGLEVRVSGT